MSVCFKCSLVPQRNITKKESVGPLTHFTGQALVNRGEKQATVLTPVYIQTRELLAILLR